MFVILLAFDRAMTFISKPYKKRMFDGAHVYVSISCIYGRYKLYVCVDLDRWRVGDRVCMVGGHVRCRHGHVVHRRRWRLHAATTSAGGTEAASRERSLALQAALICGCYAAEILWFNFGTLAVSADWRYAGVIDTAFWMSTAAVNPLVYLTLNRLRARI
ncbi:unnamed protein product [Sphagnum balticum]